MTSMAKGPAKSPTISHAAVSDELVELAVGKCPHGVLVLLQPPRGEQAHEEAAVAVCFGGSKVGS